MTVGYLVLESFQVFPVCVANGLHLGEYMVMSW